jgi:curved DNA-binding protein
MKYKDYYEILGLKRDATEDDIKKAYRRLARKYHPDVSKESEGEAKFKDVSEAYQTLKDKEKRAAYDQLGSHQAGEDFAPSQDWAEAFNTQFNSGETSFEGADLSDLFAQFARHRSGNAASGRQGPAFPIPGEDFEVAVSITLEEAFRGTQVALKLDVPVHDQHGRVRREARAFEARIPKGATNGQRLRLRGQGGKGHNGGRDGDLYLNISLNRHSLYRVDGHNLYLDLPIAPWEAALGAAVNVPTLAGPVNLKVPPNTSSGQKLRLAKRGLPRPGDAGNEGDLFAIANIVMPQTLSARETALFKELAENSKFEPRQHFNKEISHAN